MGAYFVHESQSRICENQLGRSRAFTSWLFHRMRDLFGNFGIEDPETFYKCVNRLGSGYIRTEADELQYNLHVMMRFDLEKLPPGTLASFSGENTRSGDLLSLYVKNLFKADENDKVETVHIICQFVSILRLSASGVDLLD